MSWNTARKRFQRDFDHLSKSLRDSYVKETNKYTLPTFESKQAIIPKKDRKTTLEQIGFTSGDLAYIVKGEHKGTISSIFQYSPELDAVLVSDITEKKVLPKQHWVNQQTSHLLDYPKYIPRSDIRIAAKDRDEKGNVSYVVADEIIMTDKYYDDRYKKWLPKRFIKHHKNIEIPWPRPPQEPKDGELSTGEQEVFEKTFELQSFAIPPFPKAVLDQLRNPYSKYKRKVLSELQARRLNAPEMPLSKEQQIYLAKKANESKKSPQPLSEEIQDFIGQKMADHINKIDNPFLLKHLESLSSTTNPDYEKTIEEIKQAQKTYDSN